MKGPESKASKRIPAYVQLKETIKSRILNNEYIVGEYISAAKDLEKEFGISNITVRKAFDILTKEGYLKPKQGVGTEIVKQPEDIIEMEFAGTFWNWISTVLPGHLKVESEVLDISTVRCPRNVAKLLKLADDEPIWRMKWVRKVNGKPALFTVQHALLHLMEKITAADFSKGSFLDVFQYRCGVNLSRVEQRVRTVVADLDVSKYLEINFGDPLFFVENTLFDDHKQPVEVSHLLFRGDRYLYKAEYAF